MRKLWKLESKIKKLDKQKKIEKVTDGFKDVLKNVKAMISFSDTFAKEPWADDNIIEGGALKEVVKGAGDGCGFLVCLFEKFDGTDYEEFYIKDDKIRELNKTIYKLLIEDSVNSFF